MKQLLFLFFGLTAACSSSDAPAASSSACDPAGSWAFTKVDYEGATSSTEAATQLNTGAAANTHVLTKNADGSFTDAVPSDNTVAPAKLELDADNCILSGSEPQKVTHLARPSSAGGFSDGSYNGTVKLLVNGSSMTVTIDGPVILDSGETLNGSVTGTATATKK